MALPMNEPAKCSPCLSRSSLVMAQPPSRSFGANARALSSIRDAHVYRTIARTPLKFLRIIRVLRNISAENWSNKPFELRKPPHDLCFCAWSILPRSTVAYMATVWAGAGTPPRRLIPSGTETGRDEKEIDAVIAPGSGQSYHVLAPELPRKGAP
jgi:hypothetical protein